MDIVKSSPIRIAIIEDNRFIRNGFKIMLNGEPDFEITGSYPNCEEAFYREEIGKADIILMDIKLPGISGIEGVKYLKKHFSKMLIIICTVYEDDKNVFEAIAAGAIGFISKKTTPKELLATLRNVIEGGSPMTPNVARKIIELFQKQSTETIKADSNLSDIEQKVIENIAIGKSYTTVARELNYTEKEIQLIIRSVYEKLQSKMKY